MNSKKRKQPVNSKHTDHRFVDSPNISVKASSDQFLTTKEVAVLLKVSIQWVEIGRVYGYGPPFIKITNRMVRYRLSDIQEWIAMRLYTSTSEAQAEATLNMSRRF